MRLKVFLYYAGLTFVMAAPEAHAALVAQLSLQSQPGDFIGQGQTISIDYPESEIASQIIATTSGGLPTYLRFVIGHVLPAPNTFAILDFSTAALPSALAPGVYTNAQRAAFATAGHPGLDVSFQNRGSNTLTGQFTINDASFYTDLTNVTRVASLNVSFEQHSEGATPALFGTFNFVDTAAVPEPASAACVAGGALLLLLASRRVRRVSPRS